MTQVFKDYPLDEYVICQRIRTTLVTNVPRLVTHHSPDGYEWGYGGSGPADFALNILENLLKMTGHSGATVKCWKDEYLVDTTDELKDLIDDISEYASAHEQVILTVELIPIEEGK